MTQTYKPKVHIYHCQQLLAHRANIKIGHTDVQILIYRLTKLSHHKKEDDRSTCVDGCIETVKNVVQQLKYHHKKHTDRIINYSNWS